ARERQRLAATAAEVDPAARAAPARLGQPILAAKRAKSGAFVPDRGEGVLAHVLPRERRDARRLVARQRESARRDQEVAARPAVHAGARQVGIVVGEDEEDFDFAAEPLGGLTCFSARPFERGARGQERLAVLERPAEVLRVGELEPRRAELFGERDER